MFCAVTADQPVEAQPFRHLVAPARWLDLDIPVIEGLLVRPAQV